MENEANVRFVLDELGDTMELVPIDRAWTDTLTRSVPGLAGHGLNEWERHCCLRFDTSFLLDDVDNTRSSDNVMGFFIAKFRKKAR